MLHRIIEFSHQVGKQLGKGFSENVYHEALCAHFRCYSVIYSKEQIIPVNYKIEKEKEEYIVGHVRADIVLPKDDIVIECKATESSLKNSSVLQLIVYLNLLKYNNGILINFNQNPNKELVEHIIVEKKDQKYLINGGQEKFNINGTKCE